MGERSISSFAFFFGQSKPNFKPLLASSNVSRLPVLGGKKFKKKMYSSPIYFLLAHWDAVFYCLGWGEALPTTARAGTIFFPPFVLGHILLNSHKIPAEKEFKRHPSLTDRWIWDELLSPVISWHSPAAPPSRSPAQNYNEGLDAPARLTV